MVKINEEVFYTKRLPDTVIRDQCEVQGVKRRKERVKLRSSLSKKTTESGSTRSDREEKRENGFKL